MNITDDNLNTTDNYIYTTEDTLYTTDRYSHINWTAVFATIEGYSEFKAFGRILRYVYPTLFLVGVFGNSLSFVVMCRHQLRGMVTSVYLQTLAVVDTLVLLTGLLRHWIIDVSHRDIREHSTVSCKLHIFLVYWSLRFSAWIIVAITGERFICVFYPFIYKYRITKKTAIISLMVMAFSCAIHDSHFFFTFTLFNYPRTRDNVSYVIKHCSMYREYTHFWRFIWPFVDMTFACLLPSAIIIIGNISIIYRLVNSRLVQVNVSYHPKFTSMTTTFIVISIGFVLTTLPLRILTALLYTGKLWPETFDPYYHVKIDLWWVCLTFLMYSNNACNFLLYFISSHRFRGQLKVMFTKIFTKYRVHPQGGAFTTDPNVMTLSNIRQATTFTT